jgi:hypothetical protein
MDESKSRGISHCKSFFSFFFNVLSNFCCVVRDVLEPQPRTSSFEKIKQFAFIHESYSLFSVWDISQF